MERSPDDPGPIFYQYLTRADLKPDILDGFARYQETNKLWVKKGDSQELIDYKFTDDWDRDVKRKIVSEVFTNCLDKGGYVIGACRQGKLVGFAVLPPQLFGSRQQYVNLEMFHVSRESRNKGVGKRLFALSIAAARDLGADSLYISAHSSAESYGFYRKQGCIDAQEPYADIVADAPQAYQMEFFLK